MRARRRLPANSFGTIDWASPALLGRIKGALKHVEFTSANHDGPSRIGSLQHRARPDNNFPTAPTLTMANSYFQLAAMVVKKKVVVKKKGVVKKTTAVTHRRADPAYRVSVHRPVVAVHRPACKTVVRYVKSHGRMVKTVRRSC